MAARRRLAEVILLAVLGLVAGRHPAVARRRKPTPCDPGSFMLDADAARQAETLLGLSAPVLTTTAERRLVLGECDTAMHRKVTKHATILSAVFGTCGAAHHLRF